jgi:hypothetical protein
MEALVDQRIKSYDRRSYLGTATRLHDEREALGLLKQGLEALGLCEEELPELRKRDLRKRAIAWLIRRHTSVGNRWVCEHLFMGHPSNLARYVSEVEKSKERDVVEMREMTRKAF